MITIPEEAINLVKTFEGCKLTVYEDSVGDKTIGYGHLIKPGEDFTIITEEEADDMLLNDLQWAYNSIYRLIRVSLNQNQLSALLDFVFNLGTAALERSTLRMKLNRGEYYLAADQFLLWVYARGIKLPDLVRRREIERQLFVS